ncbi:MAG: rubrerythrin [Deltaproteobacteria bacterium]|nr:rubrerythrin [Deltaproteobacteria bacterium]
MRLAIVALTVLVPAAFAAGRASSPKPSPQTIEDLKTSMHGEAFAFAKYDLFAKHARAAGDPKLAELFGSTARTEHGQHFAEEADLAGLVGSDIDNLKDAIAGERYEVETMYPEFARKAAAAGDQAAADRFNEIRQDEAGHLRAFEAELQRLEKAAKPTGMQ